LGFFFEIRIWGYPKWLVYNEKSKNVQWMIWGYPYFRKPPFMLVKIRCLAASRRGSFPDLLHVLPARGSRLIGTHDAQPLLRADVGPFQTAKHPDFWGESAGP